MKKIGIVLGIAAVVLLISFVVYSSKPAVVARVQFDSHRLVVTNGNDEAWPSAKLIINDAFGGPELKVPGPWAPGETREFDLAKFFAPIRKQYFKPEYERVQSAIVDVPGYQIWTSK